MGWSLNTRRKGKEKLVRQKGFTLIELMIVVAIIGVLAAIAMPQYNKYVARTQVAEAFTLLGPVKQALTLYHQETGKVPDQSARTARHDALGIPRHNQYAASADYIQQIRVKRNSGQIQVRFKNAANGVNVLLERRRFDLRPNLVSDVITSWYCVPSGGSRKIDEAYIQSCSN